MKNRFFAILIFAQIVASLFLSPINCHAQKKISHNNQQWLQYYNQVQISKKITLFSDVSFRRIDKFDKWSQITLRTGLGYKLTKNLNGVTGIACFEFYSNDRPSKIEFRPYQELNTTQEFNKFSIQHRFRIEGRYFRKITNDVITSQLNFNLRYRYRLFCKIPLLKLSDSIPERKLFLNIGDEILINSGKEIIYNMFDNNRLLVGIAWQVNPNLNFSFTYNYQFGQRSSPATYEHSDVFWFAITHKMAFAKYRQKQV